MTFKRLILLSICLFTMLLSTEAQINGQIAYYKSTVSVDRMKIMNERYNREHPSADIYDDWNNVNCHSKTVIIPNSYRIDLREFSMPTKTNFITSNFGYRPRFKRNHYGVDIKANIGDTIYSAFSGKIRVVRKASGYGKVIVIRHHNGLETVYGHLSKQIVKVNEHVKAGQPIGLAGNTGRSTGTHLHFETRFCGIAINPMKMFSFGTRDVTDDFFVFKK